MSTYTYIVLANFNTDNLITNINNSEIIVAPLFSVNLSDTLLSVTFTEPLTSEQLLELDYLVANNNIIINQVTSTNSMDNLISVRVATTTGATLMSSYNIGQIVDGVTLDKNDVILIKNQTNAFENGVYSVGATMPYRTILEENSNSGNKLIVVNQGNINSQSIWICANKFGMDIVGQYPLYFSQYGSTADYFVANSIVTKGLTSTGLIVGETGMIINGQGITTTEITVSNKLIIQGGVTGITGRATYSLVSNQIVATSVNETNIVYFPWKSSLYNNQKKYANGNIILNTVINNRDLIISIVEGITLSSLNLLGGPYTISSSGTHIYNFDTPLLDTVIIIKVSKSASGGISPIISGINMEFDMI